MIVRKRSAVETPEMHVLSHDSPIGPLTLVSDGVCLVGLHFAGSPTAVRRSDDVLLRTTRQLYAYFAGQLKSFDVPLKPAGTPFQLRVWSALRDIPFGETRSYGQLASAIGEPSAMRAVGAANGRNPIA